MRTFEIENDTLRYQMKMQTTRVAELTPHLEAILRRDHQSLRADQQAVLNP
jgi:hypothetical protein